MSWTKQPLSVDSNRFQRPDASQLIVAWLLIHYFSVHLNWIHLLPLLPEERPLQVASLLTKTFSALHCRCFVYVVSLFIWAGLLQSLRVVGPWKMGQRGCLALVTFFSFLLPVSELQLWMSGLTPLWLLSLACIAAKDSPRWVSNLLRVLMLQDGWSLVSQGWGKGLWLGSFVPFPALAITIEQLWLLGFCLSCWHWSRTALTAHWLCWSMLHFMAGLDAPLGSTLYAGLLWIIPRPEKSSIGPWSWILVATWLHFQANWSWLANFKALPEHPAVHLIYELKDGPYTMKIEGRTSFGRWSWKGTSHFEVRIWKDNQLVQERINYDGPIYLRDSLVLHTNRLDLLASSFWLCPQVHQNWQRELHQIKATQSLTTLCKVHPQP